MTESEKEEWKEYKKQLLEEKSKSDDAFEKYITYISSGALALTVTFIDKISPFKDSNGVWVIATAWVILALTLFINLLSHYLSSRYNEKTANEIFEVSYEELTGKVECRNKIISALNMTSIILLGIGILLILVFTILNAYNHG